MTTLTGLLICAVAGMVGSAVVAAIVAIALGAIPCAPAADRDLDSVGQRSRLAGEGVTVVRGYVIAGTDDLAALVVDVGVATGGMVRDAVAGPFVTNEEGGWDVGD